MAIKVRKRGEGDSPEDEDEQEEAAQMAPQDQDPFMRGSMRTITWMSENQNIVLAGVVIAAIVGIGIYAGMSYMHQQAVAASSGVSQAVASYQVPVDGSRALQKLKSSDRMAAPDETFESTEKKWKAVYESAGKTLDNHGKAKVAQPARLMRGAAAIELGKYEEAAGHYESYLDKSPPERELTRAYFGLAVAYGSSGKTKKAIEQLDKITETNEDLKSFVNYHKGLFYQEAGKKKKAKEMYNKVLENDPKSPYKTDVERRLALM